MTDEVIDADQLDPGFKYEISKQPGGVEPSFVIDGDEWYTFNKNPRAGVHVLASVDESTYKPDSDIKMGDHPVIWINENKKARNVYFLMGHSGILLDNRNFTKMFSNAVMWAAGK